MDTTSMSSAPVCSPAVLLSLNLLTGNGLLRQSTGGYHDAWYDRVRHTANPQEALRFSDGLVGAATADGKYVITSPNTTQIPLPVIGHVNVTLKDNGLFGIEDPILWPQIITDDPEYSYYPCVPQYDVTEESAKVWRSLAEEDFETCGGSMVSNFFVLTASRQEELRSHITPVIDRATAYHKHHGRQSGLFWMRRSVLDAMARLSHPATRRDLVRQWACLRRHTALLIGWLRWRTVVWEGAEYEDHIEPARRGYMGGFTTDGTVVQKFYQAGIPVWYMRLADLLTEDDIVIEKVKPTRPDAAMVAPSTFHCDALFSEPVGVRQFKAILAGHRYVDIERVPFPRDYEQATSPSSTDRPSKSAKPYTQKPSVEREGRCKFEDPSSPSMPPSLPTWQSALQEVNRSSPPRTEPWGYWLPEPALVVGPTSERRILRHVRHWLMARVPWLYLTREAASRRSLPVFWWRWYLSDGLNKPASDQACASVASASAEPDGRKGKSKAKAKHKAQNKAKVVQFFEDTFKDSEVTSPQEVLWEGTPLGDDEFPKLACQQVAWELSHLGFQVEFMALDDHFLPTFVPRLERYEFYDQIFVSSPTLYFNTIPAKDKGLAAAIPKERADALEAVRQIMLAWPDVPSVLVSSPPITQVLEEEIMALESVMARFYTQSFFNIAGRAAILPRRLPVPELSE